MVRVPHSLLRTLVQSLVGELKIPQATRGSQKKKKSEQWFPLKNKTKPLKEGVQAAFTFYFLLLSIHSEFSL